MSKNNNKKNQVNNTKNQPVESAIYNTENCSKIKLSIDSVMFFTYLINNQLLHELNIAYTKYTDSCKLKDKIPADFSKYVINKIFAVYGLITGQQITSDIFDTDTVKSIQFYKNVFNHDTFRKCIDTVNSVYDTGKLNNKTILLHGENYLIDRIDTGENIGEIKFAGIHSVKSYLIQLGFTTANLFDKFKFTRVIKNPVLAVKTIPATKK